MFPVPCGKIGRSKHRRAVVGVFLEPLSKILFSIPKFNEINNALILALVRFGASPAQGQTDRDLAADLPQQALSSIKVGRSVFAQRPSCRIDFVHMTGQ